MLSVTGEYALRAMVLLARSHDTRPIPGPRLAEAAGVPSKYLSAILAELVRSGLLEGTRGKNGGFRLARPARDISLADVVAPFERTNAHRNSCPFGNEVCSDQDPCSAHDRWKDVQSALTRFLNETSLHAVAQKVSEKTRTRRKTQE